MSETPSPATSKPGQQSLGTGAKVAAAALLAAITYIAAAVGGISQIRSFLGWESNVDGLREIDAALASLYHDSGGAAGQRWAIDRLVFVARTHRSLRALIAERLADFVKDKAPKRDGDTALVDSLEHLRDSERGAMLTRHQAPPAVHYALRKLGQPPLGGVLPLDSERFDLRDIIVPEFRARHLKFTKIDLSGAILYKSSLIGTTFDDCDLSGCVFSRSRMYDVSIRDGGFKGARLTGAEIKGMSINGKKPAVDSLGQITNRE